MSMKQFIGVLVFFWSINLQATTFYVSPSGNNSNAGTNVAPFLTIQHGVNQLTAGDDLIVEPGTYNEKVLISGKAGTDTDLISIISNGSVIIDGTSLSPSGREGLLSIRNSSYILLTGFDVRNFTTGGGGPTPVGILVEGTCEGIQIRNNTVRDISNTSTCTDCAEGAHGIGVFGTTAAGIKDIDLVSNEVFDNTLQSSEAFVLNGNVDGFRVINNNVHDNNNIAFDFIGFENECSGCGDNDRARNGIVSSNTAHNNSSIGNPWYPGSDGTAGGFYVDGGRYILFDRNVSSNNDIGFEFASEMPGKKTEDILMTNNFIVNNIEVGVILGGYNSNVAQPGGGSAERIHVINNSFYHNKGWGSEIVFQYRVIDGNIANNIFYGEASIGENYEEFGTGNTGNTWGRNLWWGSSTAGQSNLEGILAIANPNFIDPDNGDLSIEGFSAAISLGILQDSITGWPTSNWGSAIFPHGELDNGGNLRIESIIDLGADEFNSVLNASVILTSSCIEVAHNPFTSRVIVSGAFAGYTIRVLDSASQIVTDYSGSSSPLAIDLDELADGLHFLFIQHSMNPDPGYQNIIKE